MKEALLSVEGLGVTFGSGATALPVTQDVSFAIARGERVGMVGESGCGKSVTGLALLRLLPSHARLSGRVVFEGQDLLRLRTGTAELDALIAKTRLSSDQATRAQAFAAVQTAVREQALFAPLLFQSQIVAHLDKVGGYEPTLLGKPRFDGVFIG